MATKCPCTGKTFCRFCDPTKVAAALKTADTAKVEASEVPCDPATPDPEHNPPGATLTLGYTPQGGIGFSSEGSDVVGIVSPKFCKEHEKDYNAISLAAHQVIVAAMEG